MCKERMGVGAYRDGGTPPPQFLLRPPLGGGVGSSEPKVPKVKGEDRHGV